jgi:hypothetical protein
VKTGPAHSKHIQGGATRRLATVSATAVAGWAFLLVLTGAGCHRPARPLTPVPADHVEALTGFIKHEACQPSTCGDFVCEAFSEGVTQGMPSRIVRCRWNDNRTENARRCAYVHYSVDTARMAYGELFLSTPAIGEACHSDQAFNERVRGSARYTGAVP